MTEMPSSNWTEEVLHELDDVTAHARKLVEDANGRVFTVRPEQTRWSAAECMAHLTITGQAFIPILRQGIATAHASQPQRPARMDFLGRVLRWLMEPPVRTRFKTRAPFVPRAVRAKADALAEFTAMQSEISKEVRAAADIDVTGTKVTSAFNEKIRYNIYSAFRILAAHERRHLWQAERALEDVAARMRSGQPQPDSNAA